MSKDYLKTISDLNRPARLTFALLCLAAFSCAASLPEGVGEAEIARICSQCHSLEQATSLRQGQAGWTDTISKMINLGAQGSPGDFNRILSYLVKFYGPPGAGGDHASSPVKEQPMSSTSAAGAAAPNVEGGFPPANAANRKEASLPSGGLAVDAAMEWRTYGHDPGGMRFSPLKQITPENVGRLKLVWIYHMKPAWL